MLNSSYVLKNVPNVNVTNISTTLTPFFILQSCRELKKEPKNAIPYFEHCVIYNQPSIGKFESPFTAPELSNQSSVV